MMGDACRQTPTRYLLETFSSPSLSPLEPTVVRLHYKWWRDWWHQQLPLKVVVASALTSTIQRDPGLFIGRVAGEGEIFIPEHEKKTLRVGEQHPQDFSLTSNSIELRNRQT